MTYTQGVKFIIAVAAPKRNVIGRDVTAKMNVFKIRLRYGTIVSLFRGENIRDTKVTRFVTTKISTSER